MMILANNGPKHDRIDTQSIYSCIIPLRVKMFLVQESFRSFFSVLFLIFVAIKFLLHIRSKVMSIVFNKGADVKSDPASNETKRYSLSSNYFGISLIFSSVGKEYLTTY